MSPKAAGKSSFDLVDPARVFAGLDLRPGEVFLDLACGSGRYALAAAPRLGPQGVVHALDLWEEGIRLLEEEAARKGLENIRPVVADLGRRLPLEADSVDVCLMATVLHDLAEEGISAGAVQEAARVLRKGGRLVVVEFEKVASEPGPPAAIRLSPEQVTALVVPFGFREDLEAPVGDHLYLMGFTRHT